MYSIDNSIISHFHFHYLQIEYQLHVLEHLQFVHHFQVELEFRFVHHPEIQ